MLRLEGVRVRYGEQEVLRGVDLHVGARRTLALVGPSGCGKSTVLRASLGLVPCAAGRVVVDGDDLARADLRAVRHKVGYVVQDGGLFPHLTARGNAALLPTHLGWTRDRVDQRLRELCALTRLDESLLDRHPTELSGGQRQRVGLVRALMLGPRLLLLDEPLGALDPMVRTALQEDLRATFHALGTTVVLVTHDLAEAAFFADEVAVLEGGAVALQGPLDVVLSAPPESFVGRFVRAQRALHLPPTQTSPPSPTAATSAETP
jgi:osmoprotectant transport system ATP-binding protein